jgi:hypothetical protein
VHCIFDVLLFSLARIIQAFSHKKANGLSASRGGGAERKQGVWMVRASG